MKRTALALALALLVVWPAGAGALPKGAKVKTYVGGLSGAVDIAWVPGTSKIFYTQQGGKVGVINKGHRLKRACRRLDVDASGERGALGIVAHPRYKRNHYIYVYYTNDSPHENRITRFKVRKNRCRNPKHIVTGIPSPASIHNGGQIDIVRGKLFVATGDGGNAANAQNQGTRLGKVLRYKLDGSVPNDNPFGPTNSVWSYGHRNGFGLTHNPRTNRIYQTENGPECDDELNLIKKGRNYGWGSGYDCGDPVGTNPKAPLERWTPPIVPTDPWWYFGKMKALSNSLYMGDYARGRLHRFVMNRKGTRVRADRIIYDASSAIVDVSKGPRGWLYFLTRSTLFRIAPR
ncbi:MAG: PQQ-dependent sugar dehydrogenase [Actinomycetota bacterium]